MAGVDLHSHSRASDGELEPADLVAHMKQCGVSLLALTDHDTVAGIGAARRAAQAHGLAFIPGVEISVTWQKRTLHIVGLGIDIEDRTLQSGLARLQEVRRERADVMVERLEKLGVTDARARMARVAGEAQITRTHVARVLVHAGLCRDLDQAFRRYLRPGKALHVAAGWASLQEAIRWIHAAGGRAVLAHPLRYGMSAAWRERMYEVFKAAGGEALEVCSGAAPAAEVHLLAGDAVRHGLRGSVGTDFHGHGQHWLNPERLPPLPPSVPPIWTEIGPV